MKKVFTLVIVMLVALTSSKVFAQSGDKKFSLGIALEGALPVSGFSSIYSVGGGATLRAAISLDKSSAVTATSGVIVFAPKSSAGSGLKAQINVPVKAGFRYMFTDNVYGIGEAGITFAKIYASNGQGGTVSGNSTEFTYAPGIGVLLGSFDASIRYEGYTGSGFLGLRVGFNF
jgi:hypothetical protein